MFDSLADRMREDQHKEVGTGEVILRWMAVGVITLLVVGGVYFAVHLMQ
jgi:hypothetical protein